MLGFCEWDGIIEIIGERRVYIFCVVRVTMACRGSLRIFNWIESGDTHVQDPFCFSNNAGNRVRVSD